ncbi:MAG: phosphoglycerate dehydrogenase [Burkholderiales bacterium]|nr:phosphoglycerate dehydrogenase [Burkholderiales bacterium]
MPEPFRILTLNSISACGLERFAPRRYEVGPKIDNPDAILLRSFDMHNMGIPESVLAIARAGAGTNNIPVAKMTSHGIPVFNTPGANANAVKELVLAAMLMGARNLIPAIKFAESLEGVDIGKQVEEGKKAFAGSELPGHTLGIIGLGAIGRLVAETALRLGMNVMGYDPEITVDAAWGLPSQVVRAYSVEALLKASDFVTLHVPLLDSTRNLIDAKRLSVMKKSAILLNFARDGIVDEDAVIAALEARKIKSYICDFPGEKLKGRQGVVAFPHLGASTREAEDNCAVMAASQVMDYLEHGNILNTVNFPNLEMARESNYRIAIVNANVPNMLGQISTAFAGAGINIHNMANKSRGEIAYTLVDIDSPASSPVIEQIASIPGVVRVRDLALRHE